MSRSEQFLVALAVVGALLWQLYSGRGLGVWWRSNITRQDDPGAYWFVCALQFAILILVRLTGRMWHVRN